VDPPPDPYANKPPAIQVLARDGSLLRAFTSSDEKWRLRLPVKPGSPVSPKVVSPHLLTAVLEHEDRHFFRHPGVNPLSVVRAAWTNLTHRRIVSGASTMTMQLARLTRSRPRSLRAKVAQVYRAVQYEWLYSKAEILAAYLELAPYGGNLEGVEAAAHHYFGKPARELSLGESALLAVIPQAPVRHHPLRRPAAAKDARDRLIRTLCRRGRIDEEAALEATALPLPGERHPWPFRAPHLAEWVVWRGEPGHGIWTTTIDGEIQARAESLVRSHVRDLRPIGIGQGAAVVLEYATGEIRAFVGSADWHDVAHEGQVNGALAPRSPGSTLKPFLYALAIDRGLLTPDTLVEDVPTCFGSYRPENYDGEFRGPMSAEEALRTSRNVPAVRLARELRRAEGRGLYHFLEAAGVQSLAHPDGHYGLTLVLGGGEVSLLELTMLYGILARHGQRMEVTAVRADPLTAGRPAESGPSETGRAGAEPADAGRSDAAAVVAEPGEAAARLFSAEAASLALEVLVDVERPELGAVWRSGRSSFPVAWKTGTSYGHRDAWSIGIAGGFVVGVWLGNFDGRGVPPLVGSEVAAPLLFDLIEALPHDDPGTWHRRAPGLRERRICATSGHPIGPHCPYARRGSFLPGVSPARSCDLHREVWIDTATGYTVCSRCRESGSPRRQVVEWWSSAVSQYLRSEGLPAPVIPAHKPRCPALEPGSPPRILSPATDVVYEVRPGVPAEDQRIALIAAVSRGTHEVFWFVDGSLVWKGPPDRPVFVDAVEGLHDVCVKDDRGRSARRPLQVKGS
jgi:penicillin-binding protein 1C